MENESAAEIDIGRKNSIFGHVEKTETFYKNQFNLLYESGVNVEGKDADDIVEELREAAM